MINLYCKLIYIAFKSQMQHRLSFCMLVVACFVSSLIDIVGIWILFDRFKSIQGWNLAEVMLLYGIVHMGFSIAEAFGRGFDRFGQMIKNGTFDRVLLRPLNTIFQIAAYDIQIVQVGRFLQGVTILILGCVKLQIMLLSLDTITILLAVVGTTSIFYGLFIIHAAIAFWTTETLELINTTVYGGIKFGQYPMDIYSKPFKLFFTFIIPFACVGYYPIAIMLKRVLFPFWWSFIFPLAGIIFLYLSCQLWKIGLRNYRSTGT